MKKTYKYLIITVIALVIIYVLVKSPIIKEVVYLILMSFILAYSLRPLQAVLVRRGINKKISAVIILLSFVLIIIGAFIVIIPSIFKESLNFNATINKIHMFIIGLNEKIKPLSSNKTLYVILDNLYTNINTMLVKIFNRLFTSALHVGENLLSLAVIPIVVYYFLSESDIITNRALMIFPARSRTTIRKIINDIDKVLGRYIIGQFVLCGIIGVLTFIVLIIFHVDFPIILSLLNALFNIIPYFGPLFGALPAVIVAAMASTKAAIWTAILLYIIQQIEGNLISPKITGDSVSMHPLVVIILLIIGGKIGGFIGMVLAVPVGVVIKIIYEDINYYLF